MITELNIIYLAYFTLHGTCFATLHNVSLQLVNTYVGNLLLQNISQSVKLKCVIIYIYIYIFIFDVMLMCLTFYTFLKSTFYRIDNEYVMRKLTLVQQKTND